MYNDLKKENIIIDFEILVKQASVDEEISSYAEFMKNRILSVSGNN